MSDREAPSSEPLDGVECTDVRAPADFESDAAGPEPSSIFSLVASSTGPRAVGCCMRDVARVEPPLADTRGNIPDWSCLRYRD